MIRKYKKSDADKVMGVWLSANKDAHPFIPAAYWEKHFEKVKAEIELAEIYVCESNGEIAGFIGLSGDYIAGIFINKNNRNKGLGTQLLNKAKQTRKKLSLSVYKKNRAAINFYLKAGFKAVDCGVDEQTAEEEYVMLWNNA